MSDRVKFIGQASSTSLGADLVINANGIDDPKFLVKALRIRHEITLSAITSGDLDETNVGTALHQWIWRKTNRPFLNNISARAIDIWAKAQQLPAVTAYDVLTDQVAAITNPHIFDFIVPLERKQAARPQDFCVALDEIGTLTVQLPATLANLTGGTLSNWTVRVYAIGVDMPAGIYKAGSLVRIDELTSGSGNDVELKCYGNRVRSLNEYTIDTSGSPITGEDQPRIEFDGVQKYDYRNLNGGDAALYAGQGWGAGLAYTSYVQAGATPQQVTLNAPWIRPSVEQKIADMPQVNTLQMRYSSRLSDTTEARYILETVYPDSTGAMLRERVPGAENVADPNEITFRPGAAGSAEGASANLKAFLPVDVAV